MQIREAVLADVPRIQEIYNQAVEERIATCDEERKSLDDRKSWFAQFNSDYPIYVVTEAEQVTGYGCLFKYSSKSGYRFTAENSVYVHRDFRGRGLGKQMLRHLVGAARDRGYAYLEARVFEHNSSSLKLHQHCGFKWVGVQKGVANLDGKWFNNVLLSFDLREATERVFTGSPWEAKVGYCRAIRRENWIAVSGTTAVQNGEVIGPGDAFLQAKTCLDIISVALQKLGASLSDVIRTRMFVTDISRWEEYGKAHAAHFGDFPPATSVYEIKSLIDPRLLIEIEADAVIGHHQGGAVSNSLA